MKKKDMFADFANACTDEEYQYLDDHYGWVNDGMNPTYVSFPMECEQLYRVASLVAYGHTYTKKKGTSSFSIGLATWKDVEKFCKYVQYKVEQRMVLELPLATKPSNSSKGFKKDIVPVLRDIKDKHPGIRVEAHTFADYQTFTLINSFYNSKPLDQRVLAGLLGLLVANHFAAGSFKGWVNGNPQIEPNDKVGESWVALASLKDDLVPGLCQGCGKVLDRRVGSKGGRKPLTCEKKEDEKSSACSRLFQNKLRDIKADKTRKEKYIDTLEQEARGIRWKDDNDGRPLQYREIHPLLPDIHLPLGSDD